MTEKKSVKKAEKPKAKNAVKKEEKKAAVEKVHEKKEHNEAAKQVEEKKEAAKESLGKGKDAKEAKGKKAKKEKPSKPKAKGRGKGLSEEVKKLRKQIARKKLPSFRGRFGERGRTRKISREKFMKWRKPRGIDIKFKQEDGALPRTGYKAPREIRFLHPSGFREALVSNAMQLEMFEKNVVARIAGTVGEKKRREIVKKAKELGVRLLN
ncbi:MAG: eL32 family ribosomal protein [Candidatus Diapherotrites archaeon]